MRQKLREPGVKFSQLAARDWVQQIVPNYGDGRQHAGQVHSRKLRTQHTQYSTSTNHEAFQKLTTIESAAHAEMEHAACMFAPGTDLCVRLTQQPGPI